MIVLWLIFNPSGKVKENSFEGWNRNQGEDVKSKGWVMCGRKGKCQAEGTSFGKYGHMKKHNVLISLRNICVYTRRDIANTFI